MRFLHNSRILIYRTSFYKNTANTVISSLFRFPVILMNSFNYGTVQFPQQQILIPQNIAIYWQWFSK